MLTLLQFIHAREDVRKRREAGMPWPWTDNPILQRYKFCNVRREDDRVTREIARMMRRPHERDRDLWFALLVARRACNWPPTLAELGYPVPWKPERFLTVIRRRIAAGEKAFEAQAYKLICSKQHGEQADLLVRLVLTPAWQNREYFRPQPDDTLRSYHARLSEAAFVGSFHAAQVVADLKYTRGLENAADWWDFAASGPGSRRGLNRVLGRDVNAYWKEDLWFASLTKLRRELKVSNLHAQDLQNCLCEYDKFCRIQMGQGNVRPYAPPEERELLEVTV